MAAYVVVTREKTRSAVRAAQTAGSGKFSRTSGHDPRHSRHQVLEGPAIEEIIILEFPS
jgi:hypothetical protein